MEQLQKQLQDNETVVVEWYSAFLSIQSKYPDCPNLINLYEKQYLNAKTISEVIRENIQLLQNRLEQCIPPKKRKLSDMCRETEPVPLPKPNKRKLTPPQRLYARGMQNISQSENEHDSECDSEKQVDEPRKSAQNTFNGVNYPMFRKHQMKHIRQKYPEITFAEMMKKIGRRWARYKQQHTQ